MKTSTPLYPDDNLKIVKTYYANSQYACIHKMSDGSYWVQNIPTKQWVYCSSYIVAKGERQKIADRYSSMGMIW